MTRARVFGAWAVVLAPLVSTGVSWAQAPSAPAPDPAIEGEEDPARPPAKGKGVVWGVVTDAASNEPVIDAQVTVIGTKQKAIADVDGRFRLELPPGTYELRVWYEGHKAQRVQNVVIAAGKVAKIDVPLEADKASEEVVEVEAAPDRANAATQLVIRKNAAVASDAIGAQEIAKTPDRNAGDAVRRIVGATLVENKYAYVRGLGDRYSNALLNGTPLPSTEPDRQAVPLDLFPTLVLSDITIVKTFTPDMPGDFAGGSVRVNTRELPDRFLIQGTFQLGFNTQSTFRRRLTYQGGSLDWLGIDSGVRALPKEIPDYKVVRLGPKPDGGTISRDEIDSYGRKINAYMSTRKTLNLPNGNGNIAIGDSFKLGGGQEIGYIAALTYRRTFTRRADEISVSQYPDNPTTPRTDYLSETGLDQVSWGGYGQINYKPHKDHRIGITGLHSRSAEIEAREVNGYNDERQTDIRDTRLRFVSRSLTFGQLTGEHTLRALNDARLNYNFNLSLATSDEPDTRETVYVKDAATGVYSFDRGTLSGSHFFGNQKETGYGGQIDWTQPVLKGESPTSLKFGGLVSRRHRAFDARRFQFIPRNTAKPDVLNLPPDELFTRENIGPVLELSEYTRPNDSYTAEQSVYAGYLMADAWITPYLRAIIGARLEKSRQAIDSFDPYSPDLARVKGELESTDLLPSASIVLKTTRDSNLRLAAFRTVARPQLRELSPFVFTDYFGAREIYGNPNLRRTSITNADLRFEYFPALGEVMAVSVFFKQFKDPIEQVILPTSQGVVSFQNARAARSAGIEIELRKGFGFIAPAVKDLGILANVTLVSSRIELDDTQIGLQTNQTRPMAGQSPYVINLGLDYAREESGTRARILYNVFGARIAQVGSSGLDDVYESPFHKVDVTVAQRVGKWVDLRVSAENVLDWPVRFVQGEKTVGEYRNGATIWAGVTVSNQ